MTERRTNEGPIEAVSREGSPPPMHRRAFHEMHNPEQREGAVVSVTDPPVEEATAAAALSAEQLAKLEATALERIEATFRAPFENLIARLGELEDKYLGGERRMREWHVDLDNRVTPMTDRVGNLLERTAKIEGAHDELVARVAALELGPIETAEGNTPPSSSTRTRTR